MTSTSGVAQWLCLSDGPIYSVLHAPAVDVARQSTAVLFVPPFGWDEIVSYRARRYWAIKLANAGFPTLRIDLPGTAESHGDAHQPDLARTWSAAVDESGRWLLAHTGASRLAVIAIGTGGTIACQALADGAPIDDLVLWAAKGKGRAAVRELIAYAGVVASEHPDDQAGPQPTDGIDVTGFLLANTTIDALSAVDVAKLSFPEPERRRVLLLSRDDLGIDGHLASTLEGSGMAVTKVEVRDFGDLMSHPQAIELRRPEATISLTTMWLSEGTDQPGGGPVAALPSGVEATDSVRMPWGEGYIRETIVNAELGGDMGVVVISEPDDDGHAPLAAVMLNSGSIRKVGPHRMWVEVARRWANRGVASVRADFGAVGDSVSINDAGADERPVVTTVALTGPKMQEAIAQVFDILRSRGVAERFVVVGHCSGAYLGFNAALTDASVQGVFGINLQAFVFDESLHQARMLDRIVTVARGGIVKRLREQGLTATEVRQVMDAVRHRYHRGRAESAEVTQQREGLMLLDHLRDRDVRLLMLFSQEGELHAEVFAHTFQAEVELDRWPNAEIEELPTQDHMARAIWIQKLTMARLEVALDEVLSHQAGAAAVSSATSS